MKHFNTKKFNSLIENYLDKKPRRILKENKEIIIDDLEVNRRSIEVEEIDEFDAPDYADAYVKYAEFVDGTPLTYQQRNYLTDNYLHDFIKDFVT